MNPIRWLKAANRRRIERRRARRRAQRPEPAITPLHFLVGPEEAVDPTRIRFTHHEAPDVTVIIPSYGKYEMTLRCVASIHRSAPRCAVEVLVIEDASGDLAIGQLAQIEGLRYVSNPKNLGFLRSCNHAASLARGRYLHLLNNDTLVMPDAIDALVRLLDADATIGMAGSKLLYPDGRLQEAGGIIWADASGANFGRGKHPDRPEYNYVREVDYISGASILLSKPLWDSLGGFDEHFLPAYCEDSDLAFRIRRAGLKVVYQPLSAVVHLEGVSHGTDEQAGIKAYQVVNQAKFKARWREVLKTTHAQHPAHGPGENHLRARDHSTSRKTLLVIDHYVPEPDRDAGSRTMFEFIHSMVKLGWQVKFWPDNMHRSAYTAALQQMGVEVIYYPHEVSFPDWIGRYGQYIDSVLFSRPTVAPRFIPLVKKASSARLYYYGHDLHFAREKLQQQLTKQGKPDSYSATQKAEMAVWKTVDVVLYPSPDEADLVSVLDPTVRAEVLLPYAFDRFIHREAAPRAEHMLFVAGFQHTPNVDAAVWFVREILPLVRLKHPALMLHLVGSNPSDTVKQLANAHVKVTGFVTARELAAYYDQARVAVVPLRIGAGIKLKVVEAMQEGLPLVTTPIGAQGLKGFDRIVPVTDTPQAFADAVLRLLEDDAAWLAQTEAQHEYVKARFSRTEFQSNLLRLFGTAQR